MQISRFHLLPVLCFALFAALGRDAISTTPTANVNVVVDDRVVFTAPIQILMTGGDRFFAANLESIRSAVVSNATEETEALYRIRAHRVVSQLNPCHEDNYYLGNALLTWGGAVSEGNELLLNASNCRYWDYVPPFFYGLNSYFFLKDTTAAQQFLNIAAQRSPENYAFLKKTAIMLTAGQIADAKLALLYLQNEHDKTTDLDLRTMLQKRISRLEGLILLRDAQKKFEIKFARPLESPEDLVKKGILTQFPIDPLGLGYEYRNNAFELRQRKLAGTKER